MSSAADSNDERSVWLITISFYTYSDDAFWEYNVTAAAGRDPGQYSKRSSYICNKKKHLAISNCDCLMLKKKLLDGIYSYRYPFLLLMRYALCRMCEHWTYYTQQSKDNWTFCLDRRRRAQLASWVDAVVVA